jgi:hypothetical protein
MLAITILADGLIGIVVVGLMVTREEERMNILEDNVIRKTITCLNDHSARICVKVA